MGGNLDKTKKNTKKLQRKKSAKKLKTKKITKKPFYTAWFFSRQAKLNIFAL